ncbi:MAG TPA: AraC family transcriptional regulator, partial [Bacillales bacterium]
MNHQIIEKEAFEIVGKGIRVSTGNGENLRQIPAFWEQSNSNGFMEDLEKRCGSMGVLGACMEFEFKQENAVEFTYFIGIEQE